MNKSPKEKDKKAKSISQKKSKTADQPKDKSAKGKKEKPHKQKKEKPEGQPKKPQTAYFLFCADKTSTSISDSCFYAWYSPIYSTGISY